MEMSNVPELEKLMKIRCYIMCYIAPPDMGLIDKARIDIRKELLKDFLDTKVITPAVYDRLIRK
jgi:hypothetical protein